VRRIVRVVGVPVQVDLQLDEGRVGLAKDDVVGELSVLGDELAAAVVIRDVDAALGEA
jgi:hypothetical protein